MFLGCNLPYFMKQGMSRTMVNSTETRSRGQGLGVAGGGVARIKNIPMARWLMQGLSQSEAPVYRDLLPVGCIANTSPETV